MLTTSRVVSKGSVCRSFSSRCSHLFVVYHSISTAHRLHQAVRIRRYAPHGTQDIVPWFPVFSTELWRMIFWSVTMVIENLTDQSCILLVDKVARNLLWSIIVWDSGDCQQLANQPGCNGINSAKIIDWLEKHLPPFCFIFFFSCCIHRDIEAQTELVGSVWKRRERRV